jgi:LPPG:FO 2-phospho-L-lactate transferase
MKIAALAGGVGGAKLAHGFAQILAAGDLSVIVNTGDDFEHYGLYICPDLDTVCYTLAGLANPQTGWGRDDEGWSAIETAQKLGGPGWFRLGDRDLGTHLERTRRMGEGETLSEITRVFCRVWGIQHTVLPMSDQPVRTLVKTLEYGELPFQEYFVKFKCEPKVLGFHFSGTEAAAPASGVLDAVHAADAVVICPSNPLVSIDPILSIAGIRSAIESKIVVAVSPIIAGKAVKGPVTKIFTELGITPSALAVASHYQSLLRGFVMDTLDRNLVGGLQIPTLTTDTLMNSLTKRTALAQDVLHFIGRLQTL